jgi:hypothetical protein
MTIAALDRLVAAQATLIEALDGDDAAGLEAAVAAFGQILDLLKTPGQWHPTPETIAQLTKALAIAETARARVNYLTDRNRRRMELFTAAVGAERRTPAYGPDGRIRA